MMFVYEAFLTDQAGRSRGMGYAVSARRLQAMSRPRSVHFSLDVAWASGIVGVIHKAAPSGPIRLDGERVGLSNKAALAS